MRRLWLALLIVVFLAACSSAPQKVSRGSSASAGYAWRTKPPGFPNFVDHSVGREEISIQAMGLVGIPYRWGGNTPDSGFDCSGLVKYVFARAASEDLPRTTLDMSQRGESIEPDQIAAGDLVFFNTTGRPHSHVGIYVGKLRFVNAPSTGGTVRLDYLTNPYWSKHFDGIRRLAPAKRAPTPFDAPTFDASTPAPPAAPPAPRAPVVAAVAPAAVPAPVAADAQNRLTTTQPTAYANSASAAPSADAFEPPPQAISAAQTQARDAGAITPAASGDAPRDAIDAAADAFEPPPAAVNAAQRQAAQAGSTPIPPAQSAQPVQIMRASTAGGGQPAPTQSGDDPIARFANGSF
ncbi:cell wall-associated NlpC family hydrolase [Paraburkholderia eburnea]|uniref:Cell wall-associated NlpC family hydrolase n=1 Tax=Paraburkholderia eburnea TaxID=1189126 RepID=A0A2S4M424_9BURK|nr:C40 family peptidase [Paraburkholderia eburnea]POR49450.1 cell wall-associated NlpC family hydrolase [Paraburkholderia eburnea]PRZ19920.1 cell wall-associated NlpC family hydrolase [Paraburkholderia eburnea]